MLMLTLDQGEQFSIDVRKSYIEQLKDIYKALQVHVFTLLLRLTSTEIRRVDAGYEAHAYCVPRCHALG